MTNPLFVELFAGLHGWGEGALAEGFQVVGFDIVDMPKEIGHQRPDGVQLVLQDVRSIHGSQLKNASVIVASPPCQKYSYMAMPWSKAKALRMWYRDPEHPERIVQLNELFNACFRIQREASEAAGRYIPMVVENVKGAQPWVGRAAWKFGSYFLWGDVPALMPSPAKLRKSSHIPLCETPKGTGATSWFFGNSKHEARNYGVKVESEMGRRTDIGNGARFTSRKAASAQIAKIPFPLAQHIARCFRYNTQSV